MSWRYQPVWTETENERSYTLCEVYLDDNGQLKDWTETRNMSPSGANLEELARDLKLMSNDVLRWEPVNYDDLKVGMIFKCKQ